VDEFTVDSSAATHVVVNNGTSTANTHLTMKPWIPNLDVNCAMFASYSTFAGGATAYSINTSDQTAVNVNGDPAMELVIDPSTGETQAVIRVDLEIPESDNSYCFKAVFDQHSKYGTPVSLPVLCNGEPCRFTIYPLYIAEGCSEWHTLKTKAESDNRTVPNHPVNHRHKMSPIESTKFTVKMISTENDANRFDCLTDGRFPDWDPDIALTDQAKVTDDPYSVKICETTFEDVVVVYKIDILRVPQYLFCSAKYWTPIKFKVQNAPAVNVSDFSSLEATLHYTDKDGIWHAVTIAGLKNYLEAVWGEDNTFECYINPANYASLSIPDKNYSEMAYFVLEATIKIIDETCTSTSDLTDSEAQIVKKLVDKKLYAVDMTDNTIEFTVSRSECAIDTDPIAKWEALSVPVDYGIDVQPREGWNLNYIDRAYDTSGTAGSPPMPYWCDPKIPKFEHVRRTLGVFGIIDGTSHGNCYEESIFVANSSFSSTLSAYPSTPAIQSKTRLKQRSANSWYGTYVGKNAGKRSGAYFYISYGGKDVSVLPSGQRAMDLDKVQASGRLTAYRGMAEARCANEGGYPIDANMAKAGLNIANIWAALPNPYTKIAGTAVKIVECALAANTPSNGKSYARVECWQAWTTDDDNTEEVWKVSDSDQQQVWKVEASPGTPMQTLESAWVRNIFESTDPKQVGTCISAFVELKSMAQLRAEDMFNGIGTYSVEADGRYGASATDQADVEIVCKHTP